MEWNTVGKEIFGGDESWYYFTGKISMYVRSSQ
jgi:hypothetical protein